MPQDFENSNYQLPELEEIVTAVPKWIIRWGISLVLSVIVVVILFSAFISYPEVISGTLTIRSASVPKAVIARSTGKITKLLVSDGQKVVMGQPLGYLESTANPGDIFLLSDDLKTLEIKYLRNNIIEAPFLEHPNLQRYGELQDAFQAFYKSYLTYLSFSADGVNVKKIKNLNSDLIDASNRISELNLRLEIEKKALGLAKQDFEMHTRLYENKVESQAEFRMEEGKYLDKSEIIIQTRAAITQANTEQSAKRNEVLELNNQTIQGKEVFLQDLNSLISLIDSWKSKFVLNANQSGKVVFAGLVQENQFLKQDQEVFYIDPGDDLFYGEIEVDQNNFGKIAIGQDVLIKLKSFPFEEYGLIKGSVNYISSIPYHDGLFSLKVKFSTSKNEMKRKVVLKGGMIADAEIITHKSSFLKRVLNSLIKRVH